MHAEAALPVIVITGADQDLGIALAQAFCRRGIRVIGFCRSQGSLASTSSVVLEDFFVPMIVDVANEAEVQAAFKVVRERWGGPSILFNNAEVRPQADFLHESGSSFMGTVSLNLGGVVCCTRAALDAMTLTGRGRIINVGSFAGAMPEAAGSAYSVSTGAARIFTQALVADLADRFPDIVINLWVPGLGPAKKNPLASTSAGRAAEWGVDLSLRHDRSLNGAEFDGDTEVIRPRPFGRRILDTIRGRGRAPTILGRAASPSNRG